MSLPGSLTISHRMFAKRSGLQQTYHPNLSETGLLVDFFTIPIAYII